MRDTRLVDLFREFAGQPVKLVEKTNSLDESRHIIKELSLDPADPTIEKISALVEQHGATVRYALPEQVLIMDPAKPGETRINMTIKRDGNGGYMISDDIGCNFG